MSHSHPLDGDGVQTQLFHYLSKRGQGIEEQKYDCLQIPDTIVFFNVPIVWYYWSEVNGEIRKRSGKELERNTILQAFCKRREVTNCDIIATFLSHRPGVEDTISFMNEEELTEFLFSNTPQQGFLQKFLLPRGSHNEMLQAVWSPRLLLVNKRVNRYRLTDRNCSRNDKAITFEGPTHFSEEQLCAPAAKARVEEVCMALVEHLKTVDHHYTVSRMVLYFKEDRYNPSILWLMFSSSFRFVEVKSKFVKSEQKRTPLTLTPHFKGLHVSHDDTSRPSTTKKEVAAKRYRTGYLHNIPLEDMNAIAEAAVNAGLADKDALGVSSEVITTPESPDSNAKPCSPSIAPNNTIKAEILLERIYFNQKANKMNKMISHWVEENQKIMEDMKHFKKQKASLRATLAQLTQESRGTRGHSSPTQSCKLPMIDQRPGVHQPRSSILASQELATPEIEVQPLSIYEDHPNSSAFSFSSDKSLNSTSGSQLISVEKSDAGEARNHRASIYSLMPPPFGRERRGSALDPQSPVIRRSICNEYTGKDRRIVEALELLSHGEQGEDFETKVAILVKRKPRQEDIADCLTEERVDAVMEVIENSYREYYRESRGQYLAMAEELNDRIYAWYSEVSLAAKLLSCYSFSLSWPLACILDSTFAREKQMIGIVTWEEYQHYGDKRHAQHDRKSPRHSAADHFCAPDSSRSSLAATPRPHIQGGHSFIKGTGNVDHQKVSSADGTDDAAHVGSNAGPQEVKYIVLTPSRSRSKEVSHLLHRLHDYLVEAATQAERGQLRAIEARLRTTAWYQLSKAIHQKSVQEDQALVLC